MGNFMGYSSATELFTAIGNKIKAKQNAITDLETIRSGAAKGATAVQPATMTEALAAKQASLDQTQLAAVNSGITSEKVTQIETNKTNILYALNKVGKNDFNFPAFATGCEVSNGTKVITDETIKLTATSADCFTIPEYNANLKQYPREALISVNSGEKIVFSWTYTPHNSQTNDRVGIFGNGTYDQGKYITGSANDGTLEYTVPSGVTYVTIRVGVATLGNSATYSEMMVSKKTAYDQDPSHQPYSRQNSDLTYLEAEDRAALAEEIDAGAKNLYDINSSAYVSSTPSITYSKDSSKISVSSTANYTYVEYSVPATLNTGNYVLSFDITGYTGNTVSMVEIRTTSGTVIASTSNFNSNGNVTCKFAMSSSGTIKLRICCNLASSAIAVSYNVTNIMITTKAAFGVSKAFVPYRLSYNTLGKLKWKSYNIGLSTVSFIKSSGGVYYYSYDVSSDFSTLISITINGFEYIPNLGYSAIMNATNRTIGIMVHAPSAPQSLTFNDGRIQLMVLGLE